MKKAMLIFLVFAGCSKSDPAVQNIVITVKEPVTNLAVKGATVVVVRCNFGCPLGSTLLFSGVTDDNGVINVPAEGYNEEGSFINVVKEKYWPFEQGPKSTSAFIIPEGWMKLRITRTANYPAGSKLLLNTWNNTASRVELTEYDTAADSVVLVRGYGGQVNKIDWQVNNGGLLSNGTFNQQIPRLDTVSNITLNY